MEIHTMKGTNESGNNSTKNKQTKTKQHSQHQKAMSSIVKMKFHVSSRSQRTNTWTRMLNDYIMTLILIDLLILPVKTPKLYLPLVGSISILHIRPTHQYTTTRRLHSQTTGQNKTPEEFLLLW